ncbi:MAG TPA: oligogalacturonate lyase family protein [Bryobacteraceae bacterium]|nr:oligogalacturonate lyase family protein [Bryobacteraceae bacterium]
MGLRPRAFTRRAFLALAAAAPVPAQTGKGTAFPSDWKHYSDPATELIVYRLTDPAWTSYLPSRRAAARRGNFLLFACDRTGSPQAFRMDLKTGETRQLTDAKALDPSSLTLAPDERSFLYFDGPSLKRVDLGNLREKDVYHATQGWEHCPGLSLSDDGRSAVMGERRQGGSRLRMVGTGRGNARTVTEPAAEISDPQVRPGRRLQVLYRIGGDVWLTDPDGRQNRKLVLADGTTGPALWNPNGETILYLNFPADKTQLRAIREYNPDENQDKLVARTSQFANFAFNRNTSVFVGASRNAASPTVLLLLRVTRREFTICEHAARDAAEVNLLFSPDSQIVYFQTDRHGKPAIYYVPVEKLVEQTEG